MAVAAFKDLCIDAADADLLGRFWAAALGLTHHATPDGDARLDGPTPAHTIWVDRVPEPKSVKHRVHLDVFARSARDLVALGATVVDAESFPWTVLTDPEGGELCLFVRDEPPPYRLHEVVVDSADPAADAAWWADLLGGRRVDDDRGFSSVDRVPGLPFDALSFVPVPEPKTVKNRIHLDLWVADEAALAAAGARCLRPRDDEIGWSVWADPAGNEFCAFAPEAFAPERPDQPNASSDTV